MKTLMRFVLTVAATAFAATVMCQDLTQKVTYSTVAVPISRAVSDIAALTKVALDVAVPVRKEIVVVDVKDVTLDDLLKRIATATGCAWSKDEEGVMRLYRPTETAKAEEKAEVAARIAAIRKAIDKLAEPLKKTPTLDAKTADKLVAAQADSNVGALLGSGGVAGAARGAKALFTMGADQPAGRATARLLALLDPAVLAAMDESSRIVYSSRPTRMQLAMGAKAIRIVDTMVAEQAIWADAYQRKNSDQNSDIGSAILSGTAGVANKPIVGTPVKALLCIERQGMLDSYDLRLKLYDAQGKELFQGGQSMLLESSPLNRIEELLKDQPADKDPEIELTKDSKDLLSFFRGLTGSMFGGGASKDLDEELMAKLRSPDKYDPLSFIHSEALMAVAKAQNANLVAAVPDAIISVNQFMMPGQKLTVQGFLKTLSTGDTVTIEVKDGWMVVRPTRPVQQRARRVNRAALAQLVKVAREYGLVPLDDMAAYALQNPPLMETEVAQLYSILFLPGAITNMSGPLNWNMLRFYGSLNTGQRQALNNRQAVEFRTMSKAQLDFVRKMTYGAGGSGLQAKGPQGAPPQLPAMLGGQSNEPTELLPDGLPVDGSVTVNVASATVVKDAGDKQPRIQLFSNFGAEELGAFRALKDDPNMGAMIGSFLPELAKFRLGTRSTYTFLFQMTPVVSMTQTLQDAKFDKNGSALAYGDLPEAFRKKVDEIQAEIKKAGGLPNIFGGGGPARP